MIFEILIEPEAIEDIQKGIDWYNEQQIGLGKKFYTDVKSTLKKLTSNPFFQIRYDNVRCLPLKTFPFMIHFTINEKENLVMIHAIFNTSRDPSIWTKR